MQIIVINNQARSLVNFWSFLLRRMLTDGHQVVCLVPEGDAESDATLRTLGASVRYYPLDRKGLNPLRDAKTCLKLWQMFRQIRHEAKSETLLYASTIKPVIYGLPMATLAGIPHRYAMITGLGYMFEADNPIKKMLTCLAAVLYHVSLSMAQSVLFQNQDDIQTFQKWHCLPQGIRLAQTKGTGVDTTRFALAPLPQTAPVFLLEARLLEAKGLYDFAEAARIVKKVCPEARFCLLGPPEENRGGVPLETIRTWEHEGIVEYWGETKDVRPFVAKATVLVLPSWREGLPCSLMEGMSMGRPVIATDVPGCREVVRNGKNGFLIPLRSPENLAKALLNFVRDPDLARRMGQESRQMAKEEFDAEIAANQILEILSLQSDKPEQG